LSFQKNQSKNNYDNLICYFEKKLHWLRKRNGNNFIFGLADDDCVPMYNTSSKIPNNYGNYKSGKIKLPSKEAYQNLVFAFKNGYSRQITSKKLIVSERLGVSMGVEEVLIDDVPAADGAIIVENLLDGNAEKNIEEIEEILEGENTVGPKEPSPSSNRNIQGFFDFIITIFQVLFMIISIFG